MDLVEDEDTGEIKVAEMTPFDQQYLLRLRSAYTPQQLQLLEAVIAGNDGGFNFADWVSKNPDIIAASRTETFIARKQQSG